MRFTVVAGDAREGAAAAHLAALGHDVVVFGRAEEAGGPRAVRDPARAFGEAEAVLGPALGTDPAGAALHRPAPDGPLPVDPAWLDLCPAGTPWLLGRAGPWLSAALADRALPALLYGDRDEFALLNAIPTAEGAIAEACRRAGRTAWGTSAVVVGGGRCARVLIQRLVALNGTVRAVARDAGQRGEARVLGAEAGPLQALGEWARSAELLFNTVPAPLVTAPVLAALPRRAVVVDLASAPGGTDFEAARALGVQALLLPGIPGRLFPRTAGRIVAEVAAALVAARGSGGDTGGHV